MPEQDQDASELDHAEEVGGVIFPAGDHAAVVVQPGEQPLDVPAAAITSQRPSILACGSAAPQRVGRDQFHPVVLAQVLVQGVAIVGLVADQAGRRGPAEARAEGLLDQSALMWRSTRNPEGERKTMAVRNCHDLGPFSAARWTNTIAPFFALLKEASMKASSRSRAPRSNRSSAKARRMRSRRPSRTHCWNRRWQVWYGGYSCGRSRQRAPVRKIQSTPSSTARASRQGRPRPSALRFSRSSGRITSHCASLRCMHPVCPNSLSNQSVKPVTVFMR